LVTLLWFLLASVVVSVLNVMITLCSTFVRSVRPNFDDGSHQIFVRTNDGTIAVVVRPDNTVYDVKRALSRKYQWPVSCQRILFGRRQLKDGTTLATAGVTKGATLHLVARLRGGVGNNGDAASSSSSTGGGGTSSGGGGTTGLPANAGGGSEGGIGRQPAVGSAMPVAGDGADSTASISDRREIDAAMDDVEDESAPRVVCRSPFVDHAYFFASVDCEMKVREWGPLAQQQTGIVASDVIGERIGLCDRETLHLSKHLEAHVREYAEKNPARRTVVELPVTFGGRAITVHVCVRPVIVSDLPPEQHLHDATRESPGLCLFSVTDATPMGIEEPPFPTPKAPTVVPPPANAEVLADSIRQGTDGDFQARLESMKDQSVFTMTVDGYLSRWSNAAVWLFGRDLHSVVSSSRVSLAQIIHRPSCDPKYRSKTLRTCIDTAIANGSDATAVAEGVSIELPHGISTKFIFRLARSGDGFHVDAYIADTVEFVTTMTNVRQAVSSTDDALALLPPQAHAGRRGGLMTSFLNNIRAQDASKTEGVGSIVRHLLEYPRTTKNAKCSSSVPVQKCTRCNDPQGDECECRCGMPDITASELVKVKTIDPSGNVTEEDYVSCVAEPGGDVMCFSIGCGGRKSTKILDYIMKRIRELKAASGAPFRVLFVSSKQVHANEMVSELNKRLEIEDLREYKAVNYLKDGEAKGCSERIAGASIGVCSLQSLVALQYNERYLADASDTSIETIVVLDETVTTASQVKPGQRDVRTFPDPEGSLTVLARICEKARLYMLDADLLFSSAFRRLANRIVPSRRLRLVEATAAKLHVNVEYAFDLCGVEGAKQVSRVDSDNAATPAEIALDFTDEVGNPGRDAFYKTLLTAIAFAYKELDDNLNGRDTPASIVDDDGNVLYEDYCTQRVMVYVGDVKAMTRIKKFLKAHNMWCAKYTRMYHSKETESPADRKEFQDVRKFWAKDVALVFINTVATVALNFDVVFGSVFCVTNKMCGTPRDQFQGLVRPWRFKAVFPYASKHYLRGVLATLKTIFVLVDGHPPQNAHVSTTINEALEETADGIFTTLSFRNNLSAHEYSRQVAASARAARAKRAKGDEWAMQRVKALSQGTISLMSIVEAEAELNKTRHFDLIHHAAGLATRGWVLRPIDTTRVLPPLPDLQLPDEDGDDGEDGDLKDPETNEAHMIEASEVALKKSDYKQMHEWFLTTYRNFYINNNHMNAAMFDDRFFGKREGASPGDVSIVGVTNLFATNSKGERRKIVVRTVVQVLAKMRDAFWLVGHIVDLPHDSVAESVSGAIEQFREPCPAGDESAMPEGVRLVDQTARTDSEWLSWVRHTVRDPAKYLSTKSQAIANRSVLTACSYDDIRLRIPPACGFDNYTLLGLATQLEDALSLVGLRLADFLPTTRADPNGGDEHVAVEESPDTVRGYGAQGFITDPRIYYVGTLVPFDQRYVLKRDFLWDADNCDVVGKFKAFADAYEKNRTSAGVTIERTDSQIQFYDKIRYIATQCGIRPGAGGERPTVVTMLSEILERFIAVKLDPVYYRGTWRAGKRVKEQKKVLQGLRLVFHGATIGDIMVLKDNLGVRMPAAWFRNPSLIQADAALSAFHLQAAAVTGTTHGDDSDGDDDACGDGGGHRHRGRAEEDEEVHRDRQRMLSCTFDREAVEALSALVRGREIERYAALTKLRTQSHRIKSWLPKLLGIRASSDVAQFAIDVGMLFAMQIHMRSDSAWSEAPNRYIHFLGILRYTSMQYTHTSITNCSDLFKDLVFGPSYRKVRVMGAIRPCTEGEVGGAYRPLLADGSADVWWYASADLTWQLDAFLEKFKLDPKVEALKELRNNPPIWLVGDALLMKLIMGCVAGHLAVDRSLQTRIDIVFVRADNPVTRAVCESILNDVFAIQRSVLGIYGVVREDGTPYTVSSAAAQFMQNQRLCSAQGGDRRIRNDAAVHQAWFAYWLAHLSSKCELLVEDMRRSFDVAPYGFQLDPALQQRSAEEEGMMLGDCSLGSMHSSLTLYVRSRRDSGGEWTEEDDAALKAVARGKGFVLGHTQPETDVAAFEKRIDAVLKVVGKGKAIPALPDDSHMMEVPVSARSVDDDEEEEEEEDGVEGDGDGGSGSGLVRPGGDRSLPQFVNVNDEMDAELDGIENGRGQKRPRDDPGGGLDPAADEPDGGESVDLGPAVAGLGDFEDW
jgi:hypothetical protein